MIRNNQLLFYNKNISLNKQEILYIKGDNGSGKTTLLQLIIKILNFYEGLIHWNIPHSRTFFLPSNPYLEFENLLLLPIVYKQDKRLRFLINFITKLFRKNSEELSMGERRIKQLSYLIIYANPIWLLDEPESNLDTKNKLKLQFLIKLHLKNKGMLFVTTHRLILQNYTILL
jgi:ABC-type transport system involved in cytochrome c biogenesis ATPase subunit